MSLEFVRKTVTFRTSFFYFHLFSQAFVNHHVQQNDVLGKMSPFLEHLSVPKGCQQALAAFARPRSVIGLKSRPERGESRAAAVFRAAARSLSLVLVTPAERRETILSRPHKPARDVKIHATSRARQPGMSQRRLSCRLGNGSRFNHNATSGLADVRSWRGPHGWGGGGPAGCGGLTLITERVKKTFSGKKRGGSFLESGLEHELTISLGAHLGRARF